MRARTALVPLATVVLVCAGCGGGSNSASTGSAARSTAATGETALPVKSVSYYTEVATVSHAVPGLTIPTGSGTALISTVASSNELCWSFPPIKNVTPGTQATINGHLKFGYTSTPLGRPYTSSGCRLEPRLLLSLLEKHRHSFYILIANPKLPGSGVRGPL